MATMNPQKREELMRFSGGITGASTVNPDFANGSASPILSGQALATAQFGSGSPVTTFDYSPKSSAPAKKAPAKAAAKPAPKPSVSASVAMAKTAPKVSSRPSGESYSAPKKATVSSRADSGSLSKVALKMPGIGPMASIASKASAPAASKPSASQIASAQARAGGGNSVYSAKAGTRKPSTPYVAPKPTASQISQAKARAGGQGDTTPKMKKSKSTFNSVAAKAALKKAVASNIRNH